VPSAKYFLPMSPQSLRRTSVLAFLIPTQKRTRRGDNIKQDGRLLTLSAKRSILTAGFGLTSPSKFAWLFHLVEAQIQHLILKKSRFEISIVCNGSWEFFHHLSRVETELNVRTCCELFTLFGF
jgi:hypothetical protein